MKQLIIAVTGTAGVGKSYFAKELAIKIRNSTLVEINDLVERYRTYSKKDKFGTKIVNMKSLNTVLNQTIKKNKSKVILVTGHLAPELKVKYDVAIVLRTSLDVLARRLEKRGYQKEKIKDNLVSEALDYCGLKMASICDQTFEIENKREKLTMLNYIWRLSSGKKVGAPAKQKIEKLQEMMEMINKGNPYRF